MRHIFPGIRGTDLPPARKQLLAGLFLCIALLLPAATPAGACGLDWANAGVVWTATTLGPNVFPLTGGGCPPGATVTITVTPTAAGAFVLNTPSEDCASGCINNLFGLSHDLGLDFDPTAGGTSPIIITAVFSAPLTTVAFEVSDIDFGGGGGARLDQVVITSNAGNPTLSFKTGGAHTFSISGNTATANCTVAAFPTCNPLTDTTDQTSDSGTVVANFGALSVTTVTITYNEAGSNVNPAGRGIGILANLTATPVELTGFTIE